MRKIATGVSQSPVAEVAKNSSTPITSTFSKREVERNGEKNKWEVRRKKHEEDSEEVGMYAFLFYISSSSSTSSSSSSLLLRINSLLFTSASLRFVTSLFVIN
uniref:Uncharacterized protein n=1 Tax=Caenorhabditis tropicalis TaxID=1561998 RepID=A0A1I7V471_9PELO